MPLLNVKDLVKSYPLDDKTSQTVLKGLNFELDRGELVAVIGESGSGKSTLLNLIGGLDSDYEGKIEFDGKELKEYKGNKIDDYRKLKVGFVFQSFNLISTYTTIENIMTGANMTDMPKEDKEKRAKALVEKLGLQGLENKLPSKMSGGQKQRVAIARSMMNNPDMILADEPTGALDRDNSDNVTELLKQIAKEGTLVVVVTHSEKVAKKCDRVIMLEYGDIAKDVQNQEVSQEQTEKEVEKESVEEKEETQEELEVNQVEPQQDTKQENVEVEQKELATENEDAANASNSEIKTDIKIDENMPANLNPKSLKMWSALKTAFKNIKKNKTRNILVSLGAGIGIFAVVILLFLSSGIKKYVKENVYSTTNPLIVEVSKESKDDKESMGGNSSPHDSFEPTEGFTDEDMKKLEGIKNVEKIQPSTSFVSTSSYKYKDKEGKIFLLSTINDNVMPSLKYGEEPKADEILINEAIAKTMTDDIKSLVGKKMSISFIYNIQENKIAKSDLKISGIIEDDGTPMSKFSVAYLTMETIENILPKEDGISTSSIILVANNQESVEGIKTKVKDLGFVANRQEEMMKKMMSILDIVTVGLTAIAAISLVVSGIMILVVLFISVVERTKEIGTLRAMGASRGDIKRIFISEGFLIGVFGGLIGVTLSVVFGLLGNEMFASMIQVRIVDINAYHIMIGMLISIVVSTIASLIPASKAAKLDPIEALRYE